MFRLLSSATLICLITVFGPAMAQTPPPAPPARPTPPTRDPHTPGYVTAKELPDGANAPADADGNFIIGPTHNPAPEMAVQEGVPQGTVYNFTMNSADSKIYPGIAREPGTFGTPDPNDPAKLIVTTSHPAPYTRRVAVYVPKQYVPGTAAPFIVGADGPDPLLFTALDNLIAQKRVPVMIAISISNGSGDAQGSERGLEYDTMSGRYAEFVETEVLPLVEKQYNVKLTKDPEGRATMGGSSGGSCALIMAWYHPELYHRVLTYSGTYVNQQWPPNPETPGGAWEFHEHLIPNSPAKPIRLWMEVGDRDLFNPNVMRDDMHDWVVANENMAKVLAAKGYHYQFVFARNAGHTDRTVKQQTLPEALEYLWQGYRSRAAQQMITMLGAGGPIGDELAKILAANHQPFRLVAATRSQWREGKYSPLTWPIESRRFGQWQGSSVVHLLVGLKYDHRVWQELWPRIMANTIEACKRAQAKLIFFDNVYMYGKVDGAMTEETPYAPCSKKGEIRAKIATTLMNEVKAGNLSAMIARAADFYGPDDRKWCAERSGFRTFREEEDGVVVSERRGAPLPDVHSRCGARSGDAGGAGVGMEPGVASANRAQSANRQRVHRDGR